MKSLLNWVAIKNVKLIEGCAQPHGADCLPIKSGAWGEFEAFSFHPTKNFGALGDVGAILTNSAELVDNARMITNYETDQKYLIRCKF